MVDGPDCCNGGRTGTVKCDSRVKSTISVGDVDLLDFVAFVS